MSSEDTRIDVKACHGANYSVGSMNLSLNDTNLSLSNDSLSLGNRHSQTIKNDPNSKALFSDVTPVITHFFIKQAVATDDNKRYHSTTTKHSAAKPSRQSLAIFVSKTDLINTQEVTTDADKIITSINRYTYGIGHNDVSYDGMSELNKIPLWGNKFRRLNAVVVIPFIPFFKNHPTHTNHSGGYHA